MDWERYKALCDTPDVCSRWLLNQTLELVTDPELARRLRTAMEDPPIPKPDDHRGGAATDMFRLSLTLAEAAELRRQVERAAARRVTTSGTRRRGLGGFVEAWEEYQRYLERQREADGPGRCSGAS